MSVAVLNTATEVGMTRMKGVPKSAVPRMSEATEAVIAVAAAAEREAVAVVAEREAAAAAAAVVEKRKSSRSPEPHEPRSEEYPPRGARRISPSLRESPSLSPMRLGQKSTCGRHMAGGVYTAARMEQRRARQLAASLRGTQAQPPSSPSLTRRRSAAAAATAAATSPNRIRSGHSRVMGLGGSGSGGGGGEGLDVVGRGRGRVRRLSRGAPGVGGNLVGARMLGGNDMMRPGSGDVYQGDGELVAAAEDAAMHGASSHGDGGDNAPQSRGTQSSKVSDSPKTPPRKGRGAPASVNVAGVTALGARGIKGSGTETTLATKNRRMLSVRPEDQPKWQNRLGLRSQRPPNTSQQRHITNTPVVVPQRPPPVPVVSGPPVAGAPLRTEGPENATTATPAVVAAPTVTQGTESGAPGVPTQRTSAPSPQRGRVAAVPVSGVSPVRRGPAGPGGSNASPTRGGPPARGRRVPMANGAAANTATAVGGACGGGGRRGTPLNPTDVHGHVAGGAGSAAPGTTTANRHESVPPRPPTSSSHHSDLVELWVRRQQEHSAMHRRGERDEEDEEEGRGGGGRSSPSGDGGRTVAGKTKYADAREAMRAMKAARAAAQARRPHGVRTAVAAVAAAAAARKFARKMVPVGRRGGVGGGGGKRHGLGGAGGSDMESVQFDSEDDDDSDSDDDPFDADETTDEDEEDEEEDDVEEVLHGKCTGGGGHARRGGKQKVVLRGGASNKKKMAMWIDEDEQEDSEENSEDSDLDSKRTSQLLTSGSGKSGCGRAWVGSGDRVRLRGGGGGSGGGGGGTGGGGGGAGGGGSGAGGGGGGGGGGDGKRRSSSVASSQRCRHHHHHHHHHHHRGGHCHRRHHKHHHHHHHHRRQDHSVSGSGKQSNSQATAKTNQRSQGQQTEETTQGSDPALLKSALRNPASVAIDNLPSITTPPKKLTVHPVENLTHQPLFDYQAMGEPHQCPGKCLGIRKQYRAHRAARRRLQAAAIAAAAATAAQRSRIKRTSKNPMDTNSWTGLAGGGYSKSMPGGGGPSPYATAPPYFAAAAARMSATATAAAFAGGRRRGSGGGGGGGGSAGVRVGTSSQSAMASAGARRGGPGRVAPLAATVAARARTGLRAGRVPKKTFQIGFTRTTTSYGLLQRVAPYNTARDLRVAFAELWQVPLGCLVLYFNGRRLQDSASMWQSGVRANDVLDVFMTAEPGSLGPCPEPTSNFSSGGPGGRGVSGVPNSSAGGVLVPKTMIPAAAPSGGPPATPAAVNPTVSGSQAASDSQKGSSSFQGGVRIRLAREQAPC